MRCSAMDGFLDLFEANMHLALPVVAGRLVLAGGLGALVGIEREWRDRPAGLKTHMLVCIASATFAIVSMELVHLPVFDDVNVRMDPLRLVEAITAGVAFLAAGFIIVSGGKVKGITTGAGMWLSSAIGLACGLGMWQIAGLATLLAVIVLLLMRRLELAFNLKEPDDNEARPERPNQ
ncbi:MAG: MgtC/SapB family protein [Phyllobacterium sp.]